MDVLVLLIAVIASGCLVWLSLNNRGRKRMMWGMVGFFGIAICFLAALVLSADGDLTWLGTPIASADGNFISDFNLIAWTPVAIGLGEVYAVVLHTFRV